MSENCQLVVFSNKAYNAIIRESFDKDPVETGGILLGHVLDNGVWIVMEVLPPGINSIFQYAYFEYDEAFVNYLAQSVANQYKRPLDLLGLWHRHPGSMDVFSTTDDGTNATFARQNPAGVISGLVNIDPQFRITMYHLDRPTVRLMGRPNYEVVDVEVGDDIIPEEYFELRYFDGADSNLHPIVASRGRERNINRSLHYDQRADNRIDDSEKVTLGEDDTNPLDIQGAINRGLPPCDVPRNATPKVVNDFFPFWRASNKKWLLILSAIVVLIVGAFIFRSCKDNVENTTSWIKELTHKDKSDKDDSKNPAPKLSLENMELTAVGEIKRIEVLNTTKRTSWRSSNPQVAVVSNGIVKAVSGGTSKVTALIDGKEVGQCSVSVLIDNKSKSDNTAEGTTISSITTSNQDKVEDVVNAIIDTSKTYHNGKTGTMTIGGNFVLPIKKTGTPKVTFNLSNPNVAAIDNNGKVTAIKVGTTTISVLCNGKETDTFTLQITKK